MIIRNVSKKNVQYLKHSRWEKYNDYNVVATHEVKKTVTHPLPFSTCAFSFGRDGGYLKGFASYYHQDEYRSATLWLNNEYREHRPNYTIEIVYNLYDIELTERGLKKVHDRYELHRRNAERYAALLPTND